MAASLSFSTAVVVSVCEPSVSSEAWDIGSVSNEQAVMAESTIPINIVLIYIIKGPNYILVITKRYVLCIIITGIGHTHVTDNRINFFTHF